MKDIIRFIFGGETPGADVEISLELFKIICSFDPYSYETEVAMACDDSADFEFESVWQMAKMDDEKIISTLYFFGNGVNGALHVFLSKYFRIEDVEIE